MTRIFTITLASLIGILFAVSSSDIAAQEKTLPPNIVLFVTDDHGLDALGCAGNPVIKTPNMDKLAAEGVRFTHGFCTSASCAASRSVILTGLYGHATGSYGHVHDYHHFRTYPHIKSLPVLLKDQGYHTARIGKYHVAPESVYQFDKTFEADPRNTVAMAEACTEAIQQDAPFFLYFCPDDPHRGAPFKPDPWNTPNSFGNKEEGHHGVEAITYHPEEILVPPFLPDTPECRAELAEYYQSVSRIDQGLGRLQELLQKTGKADNTIIIYISDNGIAFPGAKTTLYEPGIRLPFIVKDPRQEKKGIVNNAMITWADLTPTILKMAGHEVDEEIFHGRSFADILTDENPKGWDEVYAAHNFHELTMYYPMRSLRERRYKLIWNVAWRLEYPFASDLWISSTWQEVLRGEKEDYGPRKVKDYLFRAEFELYDLDNDPLELKNLSRLDSHREILEKMKKKLKAFQKETADPWYIMWDNDASLQGTGVGL